MTTSSDEPTRDEEPPLDLLKSALDRPPAQPRSLLPKIQERIYQRTRGRYYRPARGRLRDPITLGLLIALLILVIITATFLVFSPLIESSRTREKTDAPSGTDRAADEERQR